MTVVKFLQDFQGVETNGAFYTRGQVVDVPSSVASRCIADKRAELVDAPTPKRVVLEVEETPGTAVENDALKTVPPEVLPDVRIDEPPPIMTSTTQATTHKRHGSK